ncbi:DcaP family trimeric outer membrane transporter [Sphingobium estronivorans]|uniref:DcaP family trimeric outer membrane transporter n=1 Tax=Sphingobium estronivorans TaxID=1577690 RepID=UPI0013C32A04|nr:DcaP family trimeric outer membrane transporter [Sphingobium estronivorans]
MTCKGALMTASVATWMTLAMVPGVARADDMSAMRAQLDQLTAMMKTMQQQQADLERRLAESEAARKAMAQAQPVPVQAPSAPAASSAEAAVQPSARPLSPSAPQRAATDAPGVPPGTIAPNPYFAAQARGKGARFTIPGLDTTLTFGGMLKMDAAMDLSGANLNGWPTDAVAIPIKGTSQAARKGNLAFTARQTRFGFGSETPTAWGPLKSQIELDFYGTAGNALLTNPVSPRLRQAWFSLGDVLVGQSWSVFMDLEAAAETLDMTGPVGAAYAMRQPLIRYQRKLGQHGLLTLGIENPEGDFLGADHTSNIPIGSIMSTRVLNDMPDFTARYTYKGEGFRISAAGVLRHINLDTGGASLPFVGPNGPFAFAGQASTWGGGAQLNLTVDTFGKDSLTLSANGGPGLGRYVMGVQDTAFLTGVAPNGSSNANPGNGAVLGPDGKLRTIFTYGGVASYKHFWSKTLRSNLVLGYLRMNNPDKMLPLNFIEEEATLHANLIWSPLPQVGFGVEFIHGYLGLRGQTDANRALGYGDHGVMNRLQFSAQYNLF